VKLPLRVGALSERNFRLLFLGQTISLIGTGMVGVALSFAVLDLTGSVSDLGFVFAARSLPMVALLLFGGVFADRLSPRAVMVGADLVRAGSQAILAALLITGSAELWHVLVLQAISGAASGFFFPATTGIVPQTVPAALLQQANSLRGIAIAVGDVIGPAIAGVVVVAASSGWAVAADAASYVISVVFLIQLKVPGRALSDTGVFEDLIAGWREFSSRRWLWVSVLGATSANAFVIPPFIVLGAAVAKTSLGGPVAWAAILAAFGAGSIAGGLIGLSVHPRRPMVAAISTLALFAPVDALLASRAPAVVIAAMGFVAGGGLTLLNAWWETTVQEQVSPTVLSRVAAYDWFGSIAVQPLGFALAGFSAAHIIGIDRTLWIAAAIALVTPIAVIAVPDVRMIRRASKPAAAEPASARSA
jgi:Transmembrane secretion effector